MPHEIAPYFGTFTGLSPTDESKIAMGEIEVVINEDGLKVRHATGLVINEEAIPLEDIRKLTDAEVRQQFKENSSEHERVDGFQVTEEGAVLLFWRNPLKERGFWLWRKPAQARLVVRLGEFIETLGVTQLYDESQVANGDFEHVVKNVTRRVGAYPFPRIQYGGLHEPCAT